MLIDRTPLCETAEVLDRNPLFYAAVKKTIVVVCIWQIAAIFEIAGQLQQIARWIIRRIRRDQPLKPLHSTRSDCIIINPKVYHGGERADFQIY